MAQLRRASRELFTPLRHGPVTPKVDVFHAPMGQDAALRKWRFLATALPYSDAVLLDALDHTHTDMLWELLQ